ncbi:GYD domain-containing protein [bacterium]|nr:GYD domain-containing protein [bacterium]|tara:strand:+ start:1392 stop:1688 length:297 start_codon:yes stop_codon:yes gene_type:complete
MQKYILLSSLTTLGRRTLKERPARMKEVDTEIRAMGIKILGQFATLGPFDFVNIVEAPNNEAISKLSIELTSRGTLQITTLPAIAIDDFIEKLNIEND